jgi:DNA-binding NarL/FixJ family response regulator
MARKVLIVEDNDVVRGSLCDWLSATFPDYCFQTAKSGEEAVNKVLAGPPAMVLMDIGLPRMNGIQATRMIKAASPETEVVMLTIHEDTKYQADASEAGANAYVTKRKMHSELIPVMRRLLSK